MSPFTPLNGNVYLSFQGVGFSSGYRRRFDALVGDNPPNITGGYANWTTYKIPLGRALTVFSHYDPTTMVVEVRFGRWDANRGWLTSDGQNKPVHRWDGSGNTEDDIASLEWMGGSNFHHGPSPAVYVYSHSAGGGDTGLIPEQYRNMPWIITGLQWNLAWRNPNGWRTRQDATITLTNYLNLSKPPAPDTTVRGGYFISKAGRDTALLIASAPTSRSPLVDHKILANRIVDPNLGQNNPCKGTHIRLGRRSIYWPIPHGTPVWVPQHQGL